MTGLVKQRNGKAYFGAAPASGAPQMISKVLLYKTISWRIIGTVATIMFGLILTGSLTFGLELGLLDFVGKTVLYMLHEKYWMDRTK